VPFGEKFFNVDEPLEAQTCTIGGKRQHIGLMYREGLLRKGAI
jgi:hypothetical protein